MTPSDEAPRPVEVDPGELTEAIDFLSRVLIEIRDELRRLRKGH